MTTDEFKKFLDEFVPLFSLNLALSGLATVDNVDRSDESNVLIRFSKPIKNYSTSYKYLLLTNDIWSDTYSVLFQLLSAKVTIRYLDIFNNKGCMYSQGKDTSDIVSVLCNVLLEGSVTNERQIGFIRE